MCVSVLKYFFFFTFLYSSAFASSECQSQNLAVDYQISNPDERYEQLEQQIGSIQSIGFTAYTDCILQVLGSEYQEFRDRMNAQLGSLAYTLMPKSEELLTLMKDQQCYIPFSTLESKLKIPHYIEWNESAIIRLDYLNSMLDIFIYKIKEAESLYSGTPKQCLVSESLAITSQSRTIEHYRISVALTSDLTLSDSELSTLNQRLEISSQINRIKYNNRICPD